MERYTICVLFLLHIWGDTRGQFQTTLNPPPPVLEVCPGENNNLSCRENGTPQIHWYWNGINIKTYIAGTDNITNSTDLLLNGSYMIVSTRLISIDSSHLNSQLEFTLLENVTSVNVSCNRVVITLKIRDTTDSSLTSTPTTYHEVNPTTQTGLLNNSTPGHGIKNINIIVISTVFIALLFILIAALTGVFIIIKYKFQTKDKDYTNNYNQNEEKVKANDHIHQDVPLYEPVSLDKEVISPVTNSAYGIQQRKYYN